MQWACLKFRVAFGTEISRYSLDGRWIKEMVLLSPNVKDSHFKTSWFKIGSGCVKRFMHPFGSSLSCPEQFSTSVSEWFGGAAKPQDETKVFICGSAVFEGEAVCLGLEGSGVGEIERKDGFRQSPAAQWLLGEAAPPFTARRPRGLSHPPSNFDSTVDAAPENGVTKQKLLL